VTLGVTLLCCVCVCRISLGGVGNVLYPVLSGFSVFSVLVSHLFFFLVVFQFQAPITPTTGLFLGKSDSFLLFYFQFSLSIVSSYTLNCRFLSAISVSYHIVSY